MKRCANTSEVDKAKVPAFKFVVHVDGKCAYIQVYEWNYRPVYTWQCAYTAKCSVYIAKYKHEGRVCMYKYTCILHGHRDTQCTYAR